MNYRTGGLLIALLVIATLAQAQIQVTLPDTSADQGYQVTIPVRVTDVSAYDIYSYEFTLKYNNLVLKPIRVDHENTICASWSAPVVNDSTSGTLVVGGYNAYKLTGKGRMVNITFNVIGQVGMVSDLTLTYFMFNNGTPSATIKNGRVTVTTNLVTVTITTNVLNGTQVTVDGTSYSVPYAAQWVIGSQHQISAPSPQTIGGNTKYIFQSWSDGGAQTHSVSVTAPTTFTATFGTQYYLSVQSSHGNPQGTGWYNAGTTAAFSIDSSLVEGGTTKHNFVSWTGSGVGSYSGTLRKANVVMNGPITETANWATQYYVNIISPRGKPFGTGWYQSGSSVNFGVDSTTIIQSNAHYQFLSWTGSGSGSYTGTSSKSTIIVSGPITEQANWDAEYLVSTGSKPEGFLQVLGAGWYKQGQQFTTIKAPDPLVVNQASYPFKGWKVNDNIVAGNPITVTIDAPKTIIADYSSEVTVVITTSVGQGTKVIVDGQEKNAPHTAQWLAGSRHSIGVVNIQNGTPGTQYNFSQWRHGGTQTQEVSPTTNTNYIAELKTQYYLEVKDEPAGVVNPKGSGWYPAGQRVKLDSLLQSKLSGQTSYRFMKWQLDGADSLKRSLTILMDKPHQAIAVYQKGFFITGTITFVGADPVPVALNISGRENFSIQSNSDGSYLIAGLLQGNYVVTLTQPGFRIEPSSRSYNISNNEENQYYFAFFMTAISPGDNFDQLPDRYELTQNYPNPVIDQTMIEYTLKERNEVSLAVYNVLGQIVSQLVDLPQPAGRYQVRWNRLDFQGSKVPSGMYFYRIKAGRFVQVKKMIVL